MLAAELANKMPITTFNLWKYISILELVMIIALIFLTLKKKRKKPDEFYVAEGVKEYKEVKIDLGNMFDSMFNAPELHDYLKTRIHPDRFPNDPEKIIIANQLSTELNENHDNKAKMEEIQAIASEKLGITFKK